MASYRRRIRALQAVVAGSVLFGLPDYPVLEQEFEQVILAGRVRRVARRHLLQVLHSTRALDSSLRMFTAHHGVPPHGPPSLGGYLRGLDRHHSPTLANRLPILRRVHFTNAIVNPRNHYLHEAGAVPLNDVEVDALLSEMHACLSEVFAL